MPPDHDINFAVISPIKPLTAKILAEFAELDPDAKLAELAEEEKLLKSLADPFLPKVFQFPELKEISLKHGTLTSHNVKQYKITFLTEKDASEFELRLKQKCLSDGERVLAADDTATLETDKRVLTLNLTTPGNTESIKKLCNRLEDSKDTYESNKAFEKELDTSIKKAAAFALNIGGLLPIIPLISCGFGKVCKEVHATTGMGSTFARTFLQIAKLGLENSHIYSTDPGSTYGDPLSNIDNWLHEIDSREKKAARSNTRLTTFITGVTGVLLNFSSIVSNGFGDFFINTLAENANNWARKPSSLVASNPLTKGWNYCINGLSKGILYGLAGVASTCGLPFRATGMLLRSAGSILSADAILLADADNTYTSRLSSFGKAVRATDKLAIDSRFAIERMWAREKIEPTVEQKAPVKNSIKGSIIQTGSDADLKKIQEKAFDLFKGMKGPSFQSSGIKDDKNQYCEVATIKLKGNSYKLLYSPTNCDISIVDHREDLNYAEKKNTWNSDIEVQDRIGFKELVLGLSTSKTKSFKNTYGEITASGQELGLSYTDFQTKKSEATSETTKIDGLTFKHNYSQYQYIKDASGTNLYRDGAMMQNPTRVSEVDELRIINDLYKTHGKEILGGNKPSTIVNHPLATTLKAIKTVQNDRSFYH
jgi:hypothetical protein